MTSLPFIMLYRRTDKATKSKAIMLKVGVINGQKNTSVIVLEGISLRETMKLFSENLSNFQGRSLYSNYLYLVIE